MSDQECPNCLSNVDEDETWTGECAASGKPESCPECMACYCDGSC